MDRDRRVRRNDDRLPADELDAPRTRRAGEQAADGGHVAPDLRRVDRDAHRNLPHGGGERALDRPGHVRRAPSCCGVARQRLPR